MIITESELMALPIGGAPYNYMKGNADSIFPGVDLSNQDNKNAAYTLAAALVYARTGQTSYRDKVITQLEAVVADNYDGARTLSVGRQVAGYVISADLIGYRDSAFVNWVDWIRTYYIGGHSRWPTLEVTAKNTCANWGSWAMSSLAACNIYLGDTDGIADINDLMDAIILGDRAAYLRARGNPPPPGGDGVWSDYFQPTNAWDPTYSHDPDNWFAINPSWSVPSQKSGCIVDDMSRSAGPYPEFDDSGRSYSWETMGGWMITARLLYYAGYTDIYNRGNQALLRCAQFLQFAGGYPPQYIGMNVPAWQVNKAYGVSLGPLYGDGTAGIQRQFGYTDWLN